MGCLRLSWGYRHRASEGNCANESYRLDGIETAIRVRSLKCPKTIALFHIIGLCGMLAVIKD
jgi:hypothetical protein